MTDSASDDSAAHPTFTRLLPPLSQPTTDLDLVLAWYESDAEAALAAGALAWTRVNFVSSIDGAAAVEGRSGALGTAADHAIFAVLRRAADVIVVGSGTVRAEGYAQMRLGDDAVAWRTGRGLAAQPRLAIVSERADFAPDDPVFDSPMRPFLVTNDGSAAAARDRLRGVADVVSAGSASVDPVRMRDELVARGLVRIHGEGGPRVFGDWIRADVVDELCLTVSPVLVAGSERRVSGSAGDDAVRRMRPAGVLSSDETLLLRYVRDRANDPD